MKTRRSTYERQPVGMVFRSNPNIWHITDWYYMRLLIYVTPRRVLS